ncbi:glycosyltransferase family 1 protein [Saccharata proteae CBS 121410]|uniref:UDP-N-acetylglucosamine transferase subunit ALG13 n=1 Tax=Saccharata proteae CBS 121410 TaxID=1314787 RepID=A0A9P4I3Z3_9PEZI|nr:glycosyltransferase family 1 protein [Saccharata proteae CBS 121410]
MKVCFVTIGATAAFDALVEACLQPAFLDALSDAGFTELLIQYGKDGRQLFEKHREEGMKNRNIHIEGFDFSKEGLGSQMRLAKGTTEASEGVVISHAGSGSILDALRINVPLVVVPNPHLLDNHQVELAEALQSQGYVVYGKLDNLAPAIADAEELRKRHKQWPPVNSGQHRQAQGLQGVMDEEMGWID